MTDNENVNNKYNQPFKNISFLPISQKKRLNYILIDCLKSNDEESDEKLKFIKLGLL